MESSQEESKASGRSFAHISQLLFNANSTANNGIYIKRKHIDGQLKEQLSGTRQLRSASTIWALYSYHTAHLAYLQYETSCSVSNFLLDKGKIIYQGLNKTHVAVVKASSCIPP
jgi:hypothetical protein